MRRGHAATGWYPSADTPGPGLIKDCNTLLSAKDQLRGSAALDWDTGTDISNWTGITLLADNSGVQVISLVRRSLAGSIPGQLGGLSSLVKLSLHINELTGEIPPELGGLSALTQLRLRDNRLTGEIPPELGACPR